MRYPLLALGLLELEWIKPGPGRTAMWGDRLVEHFILRSIDGYIQKAWDRDMAYASTKAMMPWKKPKEIFSDGNQVIRIWIDKGGAVVGELCPAGAGSDGALSTFGTNMRVRGFRKRKCYPRRIEVSFNVDTPDPSSIEDERALEMPDPSSTTRGLGGYCVHITPTTKGSA